ncbi:MAG: hypothetical protein NTW96_24320 [Planctomycetia bacterium]|nr:hypothetical protein [Planctomycetia bacterium]
MPDAVAVPIRFTTEGQILFNAGQIVIRDDEDPSCCCEEPVETDDCEVCTESDGKFRKQFYAEIAGISGDCANFNGAYELLGGGITTMTNCGTYADVTQADQLPFTDYAWCKSFYFHVWFSSGQINFTICPANSMCSGYCWFQGQKAFAMDCVNFDVTFTAADITPHWCSDSGMTVRIYTP